MLIAIDGINDERKLRIISKLEQSKDPSVYKFHSEVQHSIIKAELEANQIVIWNRTPTSVSSESSALIPDLTFILSTLSTDFSDSSHIIIDVNQPITKIILAINSVLTSIEDKTLVIHRKMLDKLVLLIDRELHHDSALDDLMQQRIINRIPAEIKLRSKEHARFMFFITNNDHGVKSELLYNRAKELYHSHPEYFDANYITNKDTDFVEAHIVKQLGVRYPSVAAENWYANSQRLKDEFDGEPINVFTSTNDGFTLFNLIKTFRGYGDKIGGMFTRSIANLKFNPELQNLEKVPVPTDTHIASLLFKIGIFHTVQKPKLALYSVLARNEITSACSRHNLDWHRIDRALWLIESENLIDHFITNQLTLAL